MSEKEEIEKENETKVERSLKLSKSSKLFGALTSILVAVLAFLSTKQWKTCKSPHQQLTYLPCMPNSWNMSDINVLTMQKVFDRLDYKKVKDTESWDVIWSIGFSSIFEELPKVVKDLEPHQLINQFTSMNYMTHKMHLAITTESKYVPQAFDFPRLKNEFFFFHKTYPDKKFVVKNFDSQGIKIVKFQDIDFYLGQEKYVQEFISNPLLVDGHAFDFGVYVLITSMDPLRMYRWKSNVMLRFCSELYQPFDAEVTGKYVVDENHIPYWNMPSFVEPANKYNLSAIDALKHSLLKNSVDVEKFWRQVDDAINSLTLSKTFQMYRHIEKFRRENPRMQRGSFQLLRFDFIIDDQSNLHLMEIESVPNTSPSVPTEIDERLLAMYEQLLFNTLTIVGASHKIEMKPDSIEESLMLSAPKDIVVNSDICSKCFDSCENECDLCLPCLSNPTSTNFHRAFREHQRRGEMMRIFPTKKYSSEKILSKLSEADKLSARWFKAKCETYNDWC